MSTTGAYKVVPKPLFLSNCSICLYNMYFVFWNKHQHIFPVNIRIYLNKMSLKKMYCYRTFLSLSIIHFLSKFHLNIFYRNRSLRNSEKRDYQICYYEQIDNEKISIIWNIVIHTSICPDRSGLKQLDFLSVKESWKISPE